MTATPSSPSTSTSTSRRALLAGALGGLGALAAGAIARVSPVRAADDDGSVIHIADYYQNAQQETHLGTRPTTRSC